MNILEAQIIETWRIHSSIMNLLVENLPADALEATLSKRGGRDISRQLAHIQNVRAPRLKSFAKKISADLIEFDPKYHPEKEELVKAIHESGKIMEKYIEHCLQNEGLVSNFKRGVVPMIGYYISHECHHRGNIMLTLKHSGHKIPEKLKWGIWEWNKI